MLELAAGQGDVGFEVAAVLGVGDRLISSDFSPAMVASEGQTTLALKLARVYRAKAI